MMNEHQDLEEKIEAAADELRQERKRFNTATMERDRFEKMSAKLKNMTRQLEGRLAEEERISGKDTATLLLSRVGTESTARAFHIKCIQDREEDVHGCDVGFLGRGYIA